MTDPRERTPPSLPEESAKTLDRLLGRCRAVILDFDGLIADSEPFHFKAYDAVFRKYGHALNPEEYWVEWTSKGNGIEGEIARHQLRLDVSPVAMREEKFKRYSEFCERGDIPVFPEAKEFLERLHDRYPVAIASGSWEHDIRAILRTAGLAQAVSHILGKAPDRRREKPHPDIFLQAAGALGVPPADCLVVEDALKGLQAARDAGIPCIIIHNPLNRNIVFDGADLVLPSLGHFVAHLQSRPR